MKSLDSFFSFKMPSQSGIILPFTLLFANLQSHAADCNCAKPEVVITATCVDVGTDAVSPKFSGIPNSIPKIADNVYSKKYELERDKTPAYELSVTTNNANAIGSTAEVVFTFPHCTIQFKNEGDSQWQTGTRASIKLVNVGGQVMSIPSKIYLLITKETTDTPSPSDSPGANSNTTPSPAKVSYDSDTQTSSILPPATGHEISLGQIQVGEGYRSIGNLVNYGGSVLPNAWQVNSLFTDGATPPVSFHEVEVSGVTTEKHIITPNAVFRITGWDSTSNNTTAYATAVATQITVYDANQYNNHSFGSQSPHSYYRFLPVSQNGMSGQIVEQSNYGKLHSATYLANAYTLQSTEDGEVREVTVIPPASGSTTWSKLAITTRDNVVVSHVTETYKLNAINVYSVISRSVDPNPAISGDELVTFMQYDAQGRLQAVSEPDGSWSFMEYPSSDTVRTYTPWLTTSALTFSGGVYSLPTSGYAKIQENEILKDATTQAVIGTKTSTFYKNFSIPGNGILTSFHSDTDFVASDTTTTQSQTYTGEGIVSTYSMSYNFNHPDAFLRNKTVLRWDSQGAATYYTYETGAWNGVLFSPAPAGTHYRISEITGIVANPSVNTTVQDFQAVANHSVKSAQILTELGLVREEQSICDGVNSFSLAVAKDYEYEPAAPHRQTGVMIGGRYISKTEYVSPTITRHFSQDGSGTETETNADGEIISSTTLGSGVVPAVVTTYVSSGNTSTSKVNGVVQQITTQDAAGRTISQQDATGAITTLVYTNGGRTVTTTRPGNVQSISTRHLDGKEMSTTGFGVIPRSQSYSVDSAGFITTTQWVGSGSARFSTQVTRWDGSVVKQIKPNPAGGANIVSDYTYAPNSARLVSITSTAANTPKMLYGLAEASAAPTAAAIMGHYTLQGAEVDGNGLVILSTDRLTEESTSYVSINGAWYQQTVRKQFHTNGSAAAHTVTTRSALAPVPITDAQGDGLRWVTTTLVGNVTSTSHRDDFFTSAISVQTQDSSATALSPDSKSITLHGQLISSMGLDATTPEAFEYDASGRLVKQTSSTGAITRWQYNVAGQQEKMIDHNLHETQYVYYGPTHHAAGQLWKVINANNEVTETVYNVLGQVTETTGNGTYRMLYAYSPYGERTQLVTYRTIGSASDLTQWVYDPATGVLKEKIYADGKKTLYTYQSNGNPNVRTWARGVTTTYSSNAFGEISQIAYSDSTPTVTYTFDRAGRQDTITDAAGVRTITYEPTTGQVDLVAYNAGGPFQGKSIDYTFDPAHRSSGYIVANGPTAILTYDPAGRIDNIRDNSFKHTYIYRPGTVMQKSRIVSLAAANSPTILTENRYHDRMNRLEGITTVNGTPAVQSRHGYELDALGRRIGAVREDGQKWDYVYNTKGELKSGIKRFADGTAIPAHSFGYNYDEIGNLSSSTRSQGQAATPLTQVTYQANALNQYTSINTPGNYTLLAELPAATNTSGVTLNALPVERWENTVWKNFAIGNTSPVSTTNTLTVGSTSITGKSLLPRLAAVPTYDFDGNLLSDGVWYYTWDAENRLTSQYMVSIPNATRYKLVYAYDSMNRRMEKTVFTTTSTATTPNASSWILASTTRFLYDGWNLVAEYLSTPAVPSYTLQATHLWGADLSESAQGAGGVGGLLSSTLTSGSYFPAYDGNGNITAWMEQSGSRLDKRDYDPFGAVISQFKMTSDPAILDKLPFGFSTKYTDKETGLLYYGHRYYNPTTKRWLNRDLIEEEGGVNLYGFVGNDGVGKWDYLGMVGWKVGTGSDKAWNWVENSRDWNSAFGDYAIYVLSRHYAIAGYLVYYPAASNWYHYLDNVGTDKIWPLYEIIKDENDLREILVEDMKTAAKFADGLEATKRVSSVSWTDYVMTSNKWFWALGTSRWYGEGSFIKEGEFHKTLHIKYKHWDPYDFKNFPHSITGGLTDADMYRLHKTGYAREFLVKGDTAWITLTWCGDLTEANIDSAKVDFESGSKHKLKGAINY